jgi:hypothetical protein
MPLRDHFRLPVDNIASWEELHGGWPMAIVQHLRKQLPDGYVAAPYVSSDSPVVVDKTASENTNTDNNTSMVQWQPSITTFPLETDLLDLDEYEVRVYDAKRGRQLVAAIEIVSPANKDRLAHRNAFVAKCAALFRQGVAVSIVDLVTVRQFNLYAELLHNLSIRDPNLTDPPPNIYAVSCRVVKKKKQFSMERWGQELVVGQPLPLMPLWLSANLMLPLDLEPSYEQACYDLWIP